MSRDDGPPGPAPAAVRSLSGRRHTAFGVRAVALFEAVKGLLVVAVGLGLAALAGKDVQASSEVLLRQLHLDPEGLPSVFLRSASQVSDKQLVMLAALAATYAVARLLEAYGLWHGWRWAQWLAATAYRCRSAPKSMPDGLHVCPSTRFSMEFDGSISVPSECRCWLSPC